MEQLALLGGPSVVTAPVPYTWPPIRPDDVERVLRPLRDGELSYDGRDGWVARLEDDVAARLGRPYVLATSSGTAALHSAYFGIGLEPGHEVLAPSYTFLATVMPIVACNATPVLVDAEPDTGNICLDDAERKVTARTRALVVTHLSGHPVDMERAVAFARRHGIRLVEDCSQAHGAAAGGHEVGTRGDVAAFSLQARKLVPAGEGGILVTADRDIYERAVMLGHFAARADAEVMTEHRKPFAHLGFGLNYRMHPLGAALAVGQLCRLDDYVDGRNANFGRLNELIKGVPGVRPAPIEPHVTRHAFYSYQPLFCSEELDGLPRQAFVQALRAEGVPVTTPTSPPLHREPFFTERDPGVRTFVIDPDRSLYRPGDLPVSEAYVERALRLPAYWEPLGDTVDAFAAAIDKVARHSGALHDWARRHVARSES